MKLPIFVHAEWSSYDKKYRYNVFSYDMSRYSGPLVGTLSVEFNPPSHAEMIQRTIAMLQGKQAELRAESEKKCTELQGQINDMLCLEHKSESE